MLNVWTYWEGPKPLYIDVCLKSIAERCEGCKVIILTPDTLPELPTLNANWKRLYGPAQRADALRAGLLYHYGGLWVDADTIMLRSPLEAITRSIESMIYPVECYYSAWTNPPYRVLNGYIYCKQYSEVAAHWLGNVNATLERGATYGGWTMLGEHCLTPVIERVSAQRPESCIRLPMETFLPVEVDKEVGALLTPGDWRDWVKPNTVAFGLNHSWLYHHVRNVMDLHPIHMGNNSSLVLRLIGDTYQELFIQKGEQL
jgi:hypothetical protein